MTPEQLAALRRDIDDVEDIATELFIACHPVAVTGYFSFRKFAAHVWEARAGLKAAGAQQ